MKIGGVIGATFIERKYRKNMLKRREIWAEIWVEKETNKDQERKKDEGAGMERTEKWW